MQQKAKKNIKKTTKWAAGLSVAGVFGFIGGAGIEKVLADQILEALKQGDFVRVAGYALVFFFIWLQVRGIKDELKTLNVTVSRSFADGERRFESLEHDHLNFEHRLTEVEIAQKRIDQTHGELISRLDNLDTLLQH